MHDQLHEVISKLNYDELKLLERDLSMGTPLSKVVVAERLQELEFAKGSCAVCGTSIGTSTSYSLVFGPKGFKKKASFCALDCLTYFVGRLKQIKQKKEEGVLSTKENFD